MTPAAGRRDPAPSSGTPPRDIVVIGASAGGVEALAQLVAGLRAGLHASLFVVLHLPPDAQSALPLILERSGPLPAAEAVDGMPIRHGRIYVARPNHHLLLERGRVRVLGGPRENGARPAIDPLFRSAAWAYGERVVGVILSGTLDDGTAGISTILRRGGMGVVQSDPLFGGMPLSALESTPIDYALPVAEIGPLLAQLAEPLVGGKVMAERKRPAGPPGPGPDKAASVDGARPAGMAGTAGGSGHEGDARHEDAMQKREGHASGFTCPECDGSLWETVDGDVLLFECRVEHKYTFETLLAAKAQEVEAAIWAAVNALEERAGLLRKSATRARTRVSARPVQEQTVERLLEQAHEAEQHAEAIRRTLLGALAAVGNGGTTSQGE